MNLAESAYDMPTGMLLHEAGKQFAMAEIVRDGWQQVLYERGGWFLLLVHAERTCGMPSVVEIRATRVSAPMRPSPEQIKRAILSTSNALWNNVAADAGVESVTELCVQFAMALAADASLGMPSAVEASDAGGVNSSSDPQPAALCRRNGGCVCGGDTAAVRAGCSWWKG